MQYPTVFLRNHLFCLHSISHFLDIVGQNQTFRVYKTHCILSLYVPVYKVLPLIVRNEYLWFFWAIYACRLICATSVRVQLQRLWFNSLLYTIVSHSCGF